MKTAEQEKLQGYPGHRKLNESAPVLDTEIPDPPRWLKSISKRAYYDFVKIVGPEGMRVMSKSDRIALVMICEAFEEWRNCRKEIMNQGMYVPVKIKEYIDKKGNLVRETNGIKIHPLMKAKNDAWGMVMKGLSRFGMTPYDRQKVSTVMGKKEDDRPKKKTLADIRKEALKKGKQHLKAVGNS